MEAEGKSKLVNVAIGATILVALVVAVVAVLRMDPRGKDGPATGRKYVAGVRESGAIDPGVVGWREETPAIALALDAPLGLAVDAQDRILVAAERLLVLRANGEVVARTDVLPEPLRAVTVDREGRVYLLMRRRVRVLAAVDRLDEVVGGWEVNEVGTELVAVTVTPLGVFVADAERRRILRLVGPPDRDVADGTPGHEVFAQGFMVPSCFEVSRTPDGDVVTVDPGRHRVQVRSAYGDVVHEWGRLGEDLADFHGCCNPAAVAVLADGRFVTAEKGLAATRVKVYSKDGELISVVAGPQSFDHLPDGPAIELDLAVDSEGRILVLDPSRRQLRIFVRKSG